MYFTDKSQKLTIARPNTRKTARAPFICDLLVKNLQNSISLETKRFIFIIILPIKFQNYALTYIIESSNQAENHWLGSCQCTQAGFVLAKKFTLSVWKLTKHNFSFHFHLSHQIENWHICFDLWGKKISTFTQPYPSTDLNIIHYSQN